MAAENVEIVRRMHERFAEVDFAATRDALGRRSRPGEMAPEVEQLWQMVQDYVDPEVEIRLIGNVLALPDMKAATALSGLRGFFDFWRGWFEPWEEFTGTTGNYSDEGSSVLLDMSITARGRGSGLPIDISTSQRWTLRDGKVVLIEVFDSREDADAAGPIDE